MTAATSTRVPVLGLSVVRAVPLVSVPVPVPKGASEEEEEDAKQLNGGSERIRNCHENGVRIGCREKEDAPVCHGEPHRELPGNRCR